MNFLDRFKFKRKPFKEEPAKATVESVVPQKTTLKDKDQEKTRPVDRGHFPTSAHASYLVRPHLSERAVGMGEKGRYVFVVARHANKLQIREAVKALYGITPVAVHMINVRGKKVRFGKTLGKTRAWKKAIITLPAGSKIDIYA